jgi:hypothetical protein
MRENVRTLQVADRISGLGGGQLRFGAPALLFQRDGQLLPGERIVRFGDQRIA